MYRIRLLVCFLLVFGKMKAQNPDFPMRYYGVNEGLSNDYVTCILKDQEGFMWFGTRNGLNRYDGVWFENIRLFVNSTEHNVIYHFAQDAEGWFWIVSNEGLIKFHPKTRQILHIQLNDDWSKISVEKQKYQIHINLKGYALFATQKCLYKIDLKTLQWKSFPMPFTASRTFFRPFEDSKGRVWVQISTSIYQFNEKTSKFKYYYGIDDLHPNSFMVESVPYEDSAARLWLSTWFDYARVYDEKSDSFIPINAEKRVTTVWLEDIAENGKRFLWAGGGNTGLGTFWLDDKRFTSIEPDACKPFTYRGNSVICLYKDQETESVWVGTNKGIAKFDPYSIRFHRSNFQQIIKKNIVGDISDIIQDKQNSQYLWLGVWADGVYKWNRKTNEIIHYNQQNTPMPDIGVFDLLQEKNGILWTANGGGISRFDPKKNEWKFYRDFFTRKGVVSNVLTLHQDSDERIWLGCNYEGVWYLESNEKMPKRWHFADIKPDERHYITRIVEDNAQNLWISSHSGLYKINFKNKKSQKIPLGKFGTQKIAISYVFISANRHIWVLGVDFIYELDSQGKIIQEFSRQNGLLGQPYSLVEDEFNYLWIGTNNGLQSLNPKTKAFRSFQQEEGIIENMVDNQLVSLSNGEIMFGFGGDLNYFKPGYFKYNTRAPKLVFKEIEINNQIRLFDFSQTLILYPGENSLKISFAALNFSHSSRNKYVYKLEGFNVKWITSENRMANFTNLEAGDYTFWVKAANNDGIWNQEGIKLKIKVIPPFYRQWWFRAFIISGIFGLIFWLFNYRQRQRQRIDAIRNRIAKDLHDDMGSTLSSIRIISEVLQKKIPDNQLDILTMLQRISQGAASLSDSMQDIIWSIKTDYDTLDDMLARMRAFALKLLESKQIEFHTIISDNFEDTHLNIEQRRNIYLIFKEAINNAIKYADCKSVELTIQLDKRQFWMIVKDDGKGFDFQEISLGNGLQNMRKRAEELKGQCQIQSEVGKGTSVILSLSI